MGSTDTESQTKNSPIRRPKGTHDICLGDASKWQRVESAAKNILTQWGYSEIRTPILEETNLFKRSVGEDTDIVNKEMFSFERSDHHYTLRPENTAGVVRAYIENGFSRQPKPVKLYYHGPMFRYERPQAGRQRQFYQLGVEVFGSDQASADVEVIALAWELFTNLGVPNLTLEINNIGDAESRAHFRDRFCQLVKPMLTELCESCQNRFNTNPFRMLDCKNPKCQSYYESQEVSAFLTGEWTSEASQDQFLKVTESLNALGIPWARNYRLVRGLDYYNNTVFEITSNHLGAQNAVCGGGRYDSLVQLLGGPPTPAVGWALGMERLISLVGDQDEPGIDYFIVSEAINDAMSLASEIRKAGKSVEVDLTGKAFGKQLAQADKRKAKFAVLLGDDELKSGGVTLKDLGSGLQESYQRQDFINSL